MKNKTALILIIAAALIISSFSMLFAWGVWGHNHINKGAILALPPEMGMFFYNHTDFIVEESVMPDIRKHMFNDKTEGSKHYIDLERFNYHSPANMPETMKDAIAKYGKDTLEKYGILPWNIEDMMAKLTDAMKNKRKTEIIFLAADLGHYIADAHMPLHTTINHNGQLTGQEGIHAFWESQLPELFGKNYHLYVHDVHYITDIKKTTWDMIDSSHELVNTMLRIESKMKKDNPDDKQYVMGPDGKPVNNKFGSPVHAYEYAHVYHELLNGMVEKQIRSSIEKVADFWYTAWVNAGKPNLDDLDPDSMTERNKAVYKEDMKAFKTGKIKGLRSDKEF